MAIDPRGGAMRNEKEAGADGADARRWRWAALGVVLATALAGCSAGAGAGSAGAEGQSHAQVVATARELVQCIREHGQPNFPDAVVSDTNVLSFPLSAPRVPESTQQACRSIFDRLPPQPAGSPPVPHAQFERWLAFARCMRAHGVPTWPDPNPDGTFVVPQDILARGKAATLSAQLACDHLNPDPHKRIDIVAGS
jgi:hypothetical protein